MENDDIVPLTSEVEKKLRITYSREILLSFSELDVCKKLPSGFNESILSEFGDGNTGNYDKQRKIGSLQGEYVGNLLVYRLEGLSNNVRGNQSRWETRSTGSSDKDAESQSDAVSQDPGRRISYQTRPWQNPKKAEHDGLLGSGAFPRPAGFTAPRSRGNGSYQLNRTTEPYQPPRPYKAVPYSRKDHTDSCNDETFGSAAECSSEDRAEEEKIRRASFELMRKEQQKIHQDKQKQSGINRKVNLDSDITALLGNPLDEKPQSDSSTSTSTSHIHTHAPRPLVPPGFSSALVEKKLSVQSSSAPLPSEAGNGAFEDKTSKAFSQLSTDATGKLMAPLSTEVLEQKVDRGKNSGKAVVQEANEVWEDDIVIMNDFSCKNEQKSVVKDTVDLGHSATVIEKLFSSAKVSSSAYSLEHQVVKADKEVLGPAIFESSKFSQRFSYEEKKPEDDFSSKELLSLIVNKEKDTEGIFDSFVTPQTPSTPVPSFLADIAPEQYSQSDNKNKIASSAVLTCEDLEQSILAEVKETNQNVHRFDANSEMKKEEIDDSASNLLLSLLHKGAALQGSELSPNQEDTVESLDKFSGSHVNPSFDATINTTNASEQTLTLESLFGASFMNALHSAEAPVSARTGGMGVNNIGAQEGQALEFQLPEEDSLISVGDSLTSLENAHNTYGLLPQNGNIEDQNTLLSAIFRDGARAPEGSTHIQKGPLEMIDPNEIYHHVHRPGSQFPHHIDQTQSILSNPHFDNLANRNQQMKFAGPAGMHHEHHLFHGNHAHQNIFGKNGGARFDPVASHHPMLQQHMQVPEDFSPHQAMRGYPRGVPMPGYALEMNNVHNFALQSALPSYGAHGTRLPGVGAGLGGTHPDALERLFEMEMQARNNTNQQINHQYPHINSHFPGTQLPENMNIRYR